MKRFSWALAAALVMTGCSSKVTQVIVTIDAEPGVRTDSTRLHLVVLGGVGRTTAPTASRFDRVLTPGAGDPAYPFKLALAPLDGDVGRSYSVTATATTGTASDAFVGQARIIGGYVEGETLNVRLVLEDACRTVACGDEQTCKAGICVDARTTGVVDAGVLDAGTPEVDAGTDGGMPPTDASQPDLGVPDLGGRCAPRPTGDTRWAQYPLPGTSGHTRSYQVETAGSEETVIDCVTGLEWERAVTYRGSWMFAIMYCNGLTFAGYSDWRLPSKIELMTLVDYAGPPIDASAFPGTPREYFWTASPWAHQADYGWDVSFNDGSVGYNYNSTGVYRARCVR